MHAWQDVGKQQSLPYLAKPHSWSFLLQIKAPSSMVTFRTTQHNKLILP